MMRPEQAQGQQLPAPRAVLTALFDELAKLASPSTTADGHASSTEATPAGAESSNPLRGLPPPARQLFVTLHCVFPNELLPALDLLDRRLVTRLVRAADDDDGGGGGGGGGGGRTARRSSVYYVRSSQPLSRHHLSSAARTSYEVRLGAWSCSCPAFTYAAFPSAPATHAPPLTPSAPEPGRSGHFGGLSLDARDAEGATPLPPVCKHLLACALADRSAPLLEDYVAELEASADELAGWAAGDGWRGMEDTRYEELGET
ncbi:MAG: hypothetical protein M1832_003881 [Thelocarpon impressellum]|nr:MAG: hypothetical protein M1832_003881 [Thelocarpon impressellum]